MIVPFFGLDSAEDSSLASSRRRRKEKDTRDVSKGSEERDELQDEDQLAAITPSQAHSEVSSLE